MSTTTEESLDDTGVRPVTIPAGFSTVPDEIFRAPLWAGSNGRTPISPTSTRSTGAATSLPGKNPSCSPDEVRAAFRPLR